MRITSKQYEIIISKMADEIISADERFNKAQDKVEELTGNKQLKVLIKSKEDTINSYHYYIRRNKDV